MIKVESVLIKKYKTLHKNNFGIFKPVILSYN